MATLKELYASFSTSFHEMRLVATDWVGAKATMIHTFVSTHSDLLYGGLAVSAVALVCFLAFNWRTSHKASQGLLKELDSAYLSRKFWQLRASDLAKDLYDLQELVEYRTFERDLLTARANQLEEDREKLAELNEALESTNSDLEEERDELQDSYSRMEEERDELEECAEGLEEELANLGTSLTSLRTRHIALASNLRTREAQVDDLKGTVSQLQSKVSDYQELTALNDELFEQAA